MKNTMMIILAALVLATSANAQTLPRPIGQVEVDWFYEVADSSGFNAALDRIDARGSRDSARVDDLETKVAKLPASAPKPKARPSYGYYTLRALGPAVEAWAQARGINGRAEQGQAFVEALLAFMEGRTLPSAASPTGGASAVAPADSSMAAFMARAMETLAEAKSILAEAKVTADSTADMRGEINALQGRANDLDQSLKTAKKDIKKVANQAGLAADDRVKKADRRAAAEWLANYGK